MFQVRQSLVRPRLQAGVSNIQIMIGVLIGAVMISGGITVLRQLEKAKVDNEVRELARLKKKGSALAAQRGGSFHGVTQQAVILHDFFPTEVLGGAATARTIRNQWGGAITIVASTTPDALNYQYTGVSSAACKQLGLAAASVSAAIQVEGTWVKTAPAPGTSSNVDQTALAKLCAQKADNVVMNFYLTK